MEASRIDSNMRTHLLSVEFEFKAWRFSFTHVRNVPASPGRELTRVWLVTVKRLSKGLRRDVMEFAYDVECGFPTVTVCLRLRHNIMLKLKSR